MRSLLLDCLGSADERELAYDSFWRPMEERHGDGDPVVLATFLQMFLARRELAPQRRWHRRFRTASR